MAEVKAYRFRCINPGCQAIDHYRAFEGEGAPSSQIALNCWKCGGGRGGQPGGMKYEGPEPMATVEGQVAS